MSITVRNLNVRWLTPFRLFVQKTAVMGKFSVRHVSYVLERIRKLDESIGREVFLHGVPGTQSKGFTNSHLGRNTV
jgi:hypothetical protein